MIQRLFHFLHSISLDMPTENQTEKDSQQVNLPFSDLSRFHFQSGENYIRYDAENVNGFEALFQLQPGVTLRILELDYLVDQSGYTTLPKDKMVLIFNLRDAHSFDVPGIGSYDLSENSVTVGFSKVATEFRGFESAGQRCLMVMLICDPQVLKKSPYDLQQDQLPECVQSIWESGDTIAESFPLDVDITQSLRVLLNNDGIDAYSRVFLQAKTNELLCLALRSLSKMESQRGQNFLSDKERQKMEMAKEILDQRWQAPPSQDEMVRLVGVGRSRMKSGFKLMFGCSMKDYVLNLRMQKAQKLLIGNGLNVTQVAMELGYEHSSNFVSAFKRQFGITPKVFQKMVATQLPV